MPKKRTSLDDLLIAHEEIPVTEAPETLPSSKTDNKKQTTVYLPAAVYEQLRALAFEERHKMHDYLLEGLDMVFRNRGLKSIAELTNKK